MAVAQTPPCVKSRGCFLPVKSLIARARSSAVPHLICNDCMRWSLKNVKLFQKNTNKEREKKWLQYIVSCRGQKKEKLGINSLWAIYQNVEKNTLPMRKYQISIGRQMPNRGSRKVFLGHLDDNFIMHKIADSPYYSLLDKHPHEYKAALCPKGSWSQLWRRCSSDIKCMR